jgi:microcystin-dependent protein
MSYVRSIPALGTGFTTVSGIVTIADSAYSNTNTGTLNESNFATVDQSFPVGSIIPFAILSGLPNNASAGVWLACDGASVSTTTYSDLFALTGYGYGGSGGSFSLPDLKERIPMGVASGFTGAGADRVTLTSSTVISHTHTSTTTSAHTHTWNDVYQSGMAGVSTNTAGGTNLSSDNIDHGGRFTGYTTPTYAVTDTDSKGSGSAHNNLQPSITIGYFIRAKKGT